MTFDWTINITGALELLALIGGSISIYLSWRIHAKLTDVRLANLAESFSGLRDELAPLPSALTKLAVQDERFRNIELRVETLEHRTTHPRFRNDDLGAD